MSKNILVISPTPSHPQDAGNKSRIYTFLSNIEQMGYIIHFLHVRREQGDEKSMQNYWGDRYYSVSYKDPKASSSLPRRILRKLTFSSFNFWIDDWYDKSLDNFLVELLKKISFNIVIVEYVFLSKALECFGKDVLKIVDTHDVFTDRHKLFTNSGRRPSWFTLSAKEEAKGLNRADVIVAIQQKEKEHFLRLTNKKVITVGHIVPLYKPSPQTVIEAKILFVGSSNLVNVHAINYFTKDILPLVRASFPDLQLILVGKICDVVEDLDKCVKLGKVEDLKEIYDAAVVVINPVIFGTGLKIKNIEALGYSKPLVTTSVGAEGLEDASNNAFLVADTPQDFASSIVRILSDLQLYNRLCSAAYDFASRWNQNNLRTLASILEEIP